MKAIISAMVLLGSFSSVSAYTCSQNEAQFIGTVKELRIVKIDQGIRDCYYKIDFSDYRVHGLCPLDESKASTTELLDLDCSMGLENGQHISGYLVEKNGEVFLDK